MKPVSGGVAGYVEQALGADGLGHLPALGGGALVVPEDGGADDVVLGIEHDEAVHLAAQADAAHLGALDAGTGERTADGLAGAAPPVLGVLLAPERPRGMGGVLGGGGGDHAALLIAQQGPGARGADVDSQKISHGCASRSEVLVEGVIIWGRGAVSTYRRGRCLLLCGAGAPPCGRCRAFCHRGPCGRSGRSGLSGHTDPAPRLSSGTPARILWQPWRSLCPSSSRWPARSRGPRTSSSPTASLRAAWGWCLIWPVFPLGMIWFPDYVGGITGYVGHGMYHLNGDPGAASYRPSAGSSWSACPSCFTWSTGAPRPNPAPPASPAPSAPARGVRPPALSRRAAPGRTAARACVGGGRSGPASR